MKLKLITLFILIVVCVSLLCFSLSSVFAQELDYGSIYNFNQILPQGDFSSYTKWVARGGSANYGNESCIFTFSSIPTSLYGSSLSQTGLSFLRLHKYYYSFYLSVSSSYRFTISLGGAKTVYNGIPTSDLTRYNGIFKSTGNYSSLLFGSSDSNCQSGYSFTISNIFIIDLTTMFGSGNEPDVETCNKLFSSDYYDYNTGTPISLNGLNSYQQGVNDALDSLNTVQTFKNFSNNAYSIDINGYSSSLSVSSDNVAPDWFLINGYSVFPLLGSVSENSIISLTFELLDVDGIFTSFDIGYLYNSTFFSLIHITDISTDPDNPSKFSYSVRIPITLSNLVVFANCGGQNKTMGFGNMVVTYKVFNNSVIVDNSYNTGFNNGYNLGASDGYDKGYTAGTSVDPDSYSFFGLINSVIRVPVDLLLGSFENGERVGGLLNFNFLGYNMSEFLMSIIIISIVIFFVRLFI